ncbi:MAG TPA: hypothetical protein V6C76_14200 [Drouetiella sp.]
MPRIKHSIFAVALLAILATPAFATKGTEIEALLTKAKTQSPDEAGKLAAQVLKLDPNNGDAHAILAGEKFVNDDRDGCITEAKRAIELMPTMSFYKKLAYNYMYHAYIQKKDYKSAIDACLESYKIEKTIAVTNDLANLYNQVGDKKNAMEYGTKAAELRKTGVEKLNKQVTEFRDAHDVHHVDKALEEANKMLAANPKNESGLALRAQCYTTKKEWNKALEDLNQVIAVNPSQGYYYAHRAKVYKALGEGVKADEDNRLAKAHGFNPEKAVKTLAAFEEKAKSTKGSGSKSVDK